MIKVILILLISLFNLSINAQEIESKYLNRNDVSFVEINSGIFKMLAKLNISSDNNEFSNAVEVMKTIEKVKILSTENKEIASEIKTTLKSFASKKNVEYLTAISTSELEVIVLSSSSAESSLKDPFVLATFKEKHPKYFLMIIKGTIDIEQVATLIEIANIKNPI